MTEAFDNPKPNSLQTLHELDRLEGPTWLNDSAQLRDEILERLEELKSDGVLYSAMQLHNFLHALGRSAFELLGLPAGAEPPPLRRPGVTIRNLYEAVRADHVANGRKDIPTLKARWRHLEQVCADKLASEVRSETVVLYSQHRTEQGAMPGTVNRELALLRRCFTLGVKMGRLKPGQVPYIPKLRENNAREGFLKDSQYEALARETGKIGVWFRALFELAYTYGWRKSELLNLRVSQIDLNERTISLSRRQTKNQRPRFVFMTDRVFELLSQCVQKKDPSDFVITRPRFQNGWLFQYHHKSSNSRFWWMAYYDARGNEKRESTKTENKDEARELLRSRIRAADVDAPQRRVVDFRDQWTEACKLAGCEGLLFHDLRRTAVRNCVRAGIPEGVAMLISGHLTRSVFDRYNIISEDNLRDAAQRIQAAIAQREKNAS